MELRHLNYFIAVAEELHFGRAAARLHMAQPPLSQQIRRLEEELGVILFERGQRRQVRLTDAGVAFLREARLVVSQAEQATLAAQRAARGLEGHLTVGFVGSVALHILSPLMHAFRRRYPDIELSLRELRSHEQIQALNSEQIQVGLLRPVSEGCPGIHLDPLLQEELLAVLPESHPLAARSRVDLAVLAREPVILPPRDGGCGTLHDLVLQVCQREGYTPRITQQATELLARIGLVAAGLGVSIVPESFQRLQREGVVYRRLQDPTPRLELSLAWREGERSALVRSFAEVAHEIATLHQESQRGNVVSISPKS